MAPQQFQPQARDCCVPLALVFIFHLLLTKEPWGAQALTGGLVQLQTRSFGGFGCTTCLKRNAVFTLPFLQALHSSLGCWLFPLPGTPSSLLHLAVPNSICPLFRTRDEGCLL